jgi:4-amino-4-deoxy-L-arabinose transferase-like glycosyltransferase
LAAEMTVDERRILFSNRFPRDVTGPYARFPGGVQLVDPARATVSFHFYHLWPVWLALGDATIGSPASLAVLSMFVTTSLLSLFLLGRRMSGTGPAVAATALVFSTFPQVYYSRLPLTEIPGQAYFLAGLFCFVLAIDASGRRRARLQLLAAALWGCLCLVRVDGVLFLVPALVCSFLLLPALRRCLADWLPLAIGLLFFVALAGLHHVAAGSYRNAVPLLDSVLDAAGSWVTDAEPAIVMAWVASAAIVGLLHTSGRARGVVLGTGVLAAALFLAITLIWLVTFVGRFEWRQVVHHMGWLVLYLPGPVMPATAAGLVFLAIAVRRHAHRMVLVLACILLVIPLGSLLVSPMVTATQPWAVRRFVPMVLPLLMLLAVVGWNHGLSGVARMSGARLDWGYVLIAASGLVWLLPLSGRLWAEPLYADLDSHVRQLAGRISAAALVIVPDEEAGTHMQTALQYGEARTTMLLPLRSETDAARSAAIEQFLVRQLAGGRQVIVLLQNAARPPDPLASRFDSRELFSREISFLEVPQVTGSVSLGTPVRRAVLYHALELQRTGDAPWSAARSRMLSDGIEFSRPVLPPGVAAMAGISHAEPDGRWTDGPVARLRFVHRLPRRLRLELDIVDVYPPNRGRPLTARVESDIKEVRLPHSRGTVRLALESRAAANTIELHIPQPTSPASRGESQDMRLLGIRVKALRVVELPE